MGSAGNEACDVGGDLGDDVPQLDDTEDGWGGAVCHTRFRYLDIAINEITFR